MEPPPRRAAGLKLSGVSPIQIDEAGLIWPLLLISAQSLGASIGLGIIKAPGGGGAKFLMASIWLWAAMSLVFGGRFAEGQSKPSAGVQMTAPRPV